MADYEMWVSPSFKARVARAALHALRLYEEYKVEVLNKYSAGPLEIGVLKFAVYFSSVFLFGIIVATFPNLYIKDCHANYLAANLIAPIFYFYLIIMLFLLFYKIAEWSRHVEGVIFYIEVFFNSYRKNARFRYRTGRMKNKTAFVGARFAAIVLLFFVVFYPIYIMFGEIMPINQIIMSGNFTNFVVESHKEAQKFCRQYEVEGMPYSVK